jgi:hypothetical protein
MKRRKVVAWVVTDFQGIAYAGPFRERAAAVDTADPGDRVVKLTSPDPLARFDAAVVKAAVQFINDDDDDRVRTTAALVHAVERRAKARGKRK